MAYSKLTSDLKKEIQDLYQTGEYTQKEISEKFNLGLSTINRILSGIYGSRLVDFGVIDHRSDEGSLHVKRRGKTFITILGLDRSKMIDEIIVFVGQNQIKVNYRK